MAALHTELRVRRIIMLGYFCRCFSISRSDCLSVCFYRKQDDDTTSIHSVISIVCPIVTVPAHQQHLVLLLSLSEHLLHYELWTAAGAFASAAAFTGAWSWSCATALFIGPCTCSTPAGASWLTSCACCRCHENNQSNPSTYTHIHMYTQPHTVTYHRRVPILQLPSDQIVFVSKRFISSSEGHKCNASNFHE